MATARGIQRSTQHPHKFIYRSERTKHKAKELSRMRFVSARTRRATANPWGPLAPGRCHVINVGGPTTLSCVFSSILSRITDRSSSVTFNGPRTANPLRRRVVTRDRPFVSPSDYSLNMHPFDSAFARILKHCEVLLSIN